GSLRRAHRLAGGLGGLAMLLHPLVVLAPARFRHFLLLQLELLQARVIRAASFFPLVGLSLTLLASGSLRFRQGRAHRDPVRRLLTRRLLTRFCTFVGRSSFTSKHLIVAVFEFADIFVSHGY